jgi:hypothetical protein
VTTGLSILFVQQDLLPPSSASMRGTRNEKNCDVRARPNT